MTIHHHRQPTLRLHLPPGVDEAQALALLPALAEAVPELGQALGAVLKQVPLQGAPLCKGHVRGYTREDGTFVQGYERLPDGAYWIKPDGSTQRLNRTHDQWLFEEHSHEFQPLLAHAHTDDEALSNFLRGTGWIRYNRTTHGADPTQVVYHLPDAESATFRRAQEHHAVHGSSRDVVLVSPDEEDVVLEPRTHDWHAEFHRERRRHHRQFGLHKALKPGGRAHAGRTLVEVERDRAKAQIQADQMAQRYKLRLLDLKECWQATIALRDGAVPTLGRKAADEHLRVARRTFEQAGRATMRHYYRRAFKLGRQAGGNFAPLTKDERAAINQLQREEWAYFANLLSDIDQKTYRMDLDRRVGLYAQALEEAFHAGFVLSDLSPEIYYRWVMSPDAEHCLDCLSITKGGPWQDGTYRARDIAQAGIFPRSGRLACVTHCRCRWERVARPEGKPANAQASLRDVPLVGSQSPFTGQGRRHREGFAQRAQQHSWSWQRRA